MHDLNRSEKIHIEPEGQIWLRGSIMEDDKEEALTFLKTCLFPRMDKLTWPHCVPVFEESYGPWQKDQSNGYNQ